VICGDSREVLKKFVNSANLIVTSPPYADARKKHYDSISPDDFTEWFFTFHNSFFNSFRRWSFILNIKDKVVNGVRHRFVWDTIKNLSENGGMPSMTIYGIKQIPCPDSGLHD
jgi:DNA modification methylase